MSGSTRKRGTTGENARGRIIRPPAALAGLLAEGKSYASIGAVLNAQPDTVSKWSREPEVIAAVRRLQREAGESHRVRLASLIGTALEALATVATGGAEISASAQVRAAEAILDRSGMPRSREITLVTEGGEEDLDLTTEEGRARLAAELEKVPVSVFAKLPLRMLEKALEMAKEAA